MTDAPAPQSLPWDEWGRMEEAHRGRTGDDDELRDEHPGARGGRAGRLSDAFGGTGFDVPTAFRR